MFFAGWLSAVVVAAPLEVVPLDDARIVEVAARADGKAVVLLGEMHYGAAVPGLVGDVLFALHEREPVSLLVLERSYSWTPWLDGYVTETDDEVAAGIMAVIEPTTSQQSTALLARIRAHNLEHPDAVIRVGASDIEHDLVEAERRVFRPFLESLSEDYEGRSFASWEVYFEYLDGVLAEAAPDAGVGQVRTPFVRRVLANARAGVAAYEGEEHDGWEAFSTLRQEAINRNLVGSEHLGPLAAGGRILVYGGSMHTRTGEGCLPRYEGCFLANEHQPTRGSTLSIRVMYLSTDLTGWEGVDFEACVEARGTSAQYWGMVERFMTEYERRGWTLDRPRRFRTVARAIERYLTRDGPVDPLLVDGGTRNGWVRETLWGHDVAVVIPHTPLSQPHCPDPGTPEPE